MGMGPVQWGWWGDLVSAVVVSIGSVHWGWWGDGISGSGGCSEGGWISGISGSSGGGGDRINGRGDGNEISGSGSSDGVGGGGGGGGSVTVVMVVREIWLVRGGGGGGGGVVSVALALTCSQCQSLPPCSVYIWVWLPSLVSNDASPNMGSPSTVGSFSTFTLLIHQIVSSSFCLLRWHLSAAMGREDRWAVLCVGMAVTVSAQPQCDIFWFPSSPLSRIIIEWQAVGLPHPHQGPVASAAFATLIVLPLFPAIFDD